MTKLKFFCVLFVVLLGQNLIHAANFPTPSILGFGTQKINQENSYMLQEAIDLGYKLFDTADKYENMHIIAPILKRNHAKNLYLIYKISPPKTLEDLDPIKNKVDQVIETLGSIDCFMLHSIEDFYEARETPMAKQFINYILDLMNQSKIKSFGISNVHWNFKEIIKFFSDNNIKISLIENHLNNSTIHFFPTNQIVNYAKENDIKFIGYGTLGGLIAQEGPCQGFCNVSEPLIHFDSITHPQVTTLSKKYKVDPMMLMLAYESRKFNVYQIPTTTSIERLRTNFSSFGSAYNALQEEDLKAISDDIGLAEPNEYPNIPPDLRNSTKFRSRLNLITNLINTDSEVIKTIDNLKHIFSEDNDHYIKLIRHFLYISEQTIKFHKEKELEDSLAQLNSLMKPEHKERFKTALSEVFRNPGTNQHHSSLMDQLFLALKTKIPDLKLLENNHFQLHDYSDLKGNTQFTKEIFIINPEERKIIRFKVKVPLKAAELLQLLNNYGIEQHVLWDFDDGDFYSIKSTDLTKMDQELDLTDIMGNHITGLTHYFAVGDSDSNGKWLNLIEKFNPFLYQAMYR